MSTCMTNKLLNFNMSKTELLVFPDKSFPHTVIPISVKKQFHPYCSGQNSWVIFDFSIIPTSYPTHQQILSAILSMNIQNQTLSYDLHYNPNDHHSCLNILTHITPLPLQRLPISLRIKLKVFAMTYKALHNLVVHYASELITHTTLPLLLSVPEEMSYLLTSRILHLLFFCLECLPRYAYGSILHHLQLLLKC